MTLRLAVIGDGGISRDVRATLGAMTPPPAEMVAILSHGDMDPGLPRVETIQALLDARPDVVLECAGHEAVAAYGPAILRSGTPLLLVSVGSLADEVLFDTLKAAAVAGGTRLILAPGALAGIDALGAARLGGLARVRYTGRKPPSAWKGTPADSVVDLDALTRPTVFYRGDARQAALLYPRNANVAATVALAGRGFADTEVELIADPSITLNLHELMFEGPDGRYDIRMAGEPSQLNPRTSALTARSVARLLLGMTAPVVI